MSEKLSICPFCGGDDSADNAVMEAAVFLTDFRSAIGTRAYRVKCQICDINGPASHEPRLAIEAWNRRHSEEQEPSTFERMMNNG